MESIHQRLQNIAKHVVLTLYPDCSIHPEIVQTTHHRFGHYQCNIAMPLAKTLKMNPRKIAQDLIDHWPNDEAIESIDIAGPGFINFTIAIPFLQKELLLTTQDERLGVPKVKVPLSVIVEFSSPNVAKELHVGHLRSTIIGESLARVFEYLGYRVLRLNHIGDWGTQFGMLIAYLQLNHPKVLDGSEDADLSSLMKWYRSAKQLFDADSAFKKKAQYDVVRLQRGDADAMHAWQLICEISRRGFSEIYDFLDIQLLERGESFYNPYLENMLAEYKDQGVLKKSDGAECVFLEGFYSKEGTPLPLMLKKSDGGFNYAATDTAALIHRIREEKAERIIYVVDAGQKQHFQMVFQAAQRAGIYDPQHINVEHVPFGVVLGSDGKKFKTRSGETEKLIDLLSEAVSRARVLLSDRLTELSPQEKDQYAHVLGVNAVKYADLSCHRVKDYVFSYDRMLQFEGNTAAYLLYSYVRIQSIKRKCNRDIQTLYGKTPIVLTHESEVALGIKIRQFPETLDHMDRDLLPHRLAEYLYDLAEYFHAFFRDCRVEGDPQESSRLVLCELTGSVLKQGLYLLGLRTLDKM